MVKIYASKIKNKLGLPITPLFSPLPLQKKKKTPRGASPIMLLRSLTPQFSRKHCRVNKESLGGWSVSCTMNFTVSQNYFYLNHTVHDTGNLCIQHGMSPSIEYKGWSTTRQTKLCQQAQKTMGVKFRVPLQEPCG